MKTSHLGWRFFAPLLGSSGDRTKNVWAREPHIFCALQSGVWFLSGGVGLFLLHSLKPTVCTWDDWETNLSFWWVLVWGRVSFDSSWFLSWFLTLTTFSRFQVMSNKTVRALATWAWYSIIIQSQKICFKSIWDDIVGDMFRNVDRVEFSLLL